MIGGKRKDCIFVKLRPFTALFAPHFTRINIANPCDQITKKQTCQHPLMGNELHLRSINALLGKYFYIPHYQRGYRWTKYQVEALLTDIFTFATTGNSHPDHEFYCLQPVVAKAHTWDIRGKKISGWEVVDGQQRLTTIFIIMSYLQQEFLNTNSLVAKYGKDLYTLQYETRPGSEEFLRHIREDRSNIDFYHISNAYTTVKNWFSGKNGGDKKAFLDALMGLETSPRSVQVIWYLADPEVKSVDLFIRLNLNKIPLTNAELIKALFLSETAFEKEPGDSPRQLKREIPYLWDEMEQRLGDPFFWAFITNAPQDDYATRIELLFDMASYKRNNKADPLSIFLFFLEEAQTGSLRDLWLKIERYYLTLCEWFKDKNLYHKVGYLVAVGEQLPALVEISLQEKKNRLEEELDKRIREKVAFDISTLSYDNNGDYKKITQLLLLFNVESIRANQHSYEFYPFRFHKQTRWSLEHIHAQASESMDRTKKEGWKQWLADHQVVLEELANANGHIDRHDALNTLLQELRMLDANELTWEIFAALSTEVNKLFSEENDTYREELHAVSNLALLSQPDNASLNNSVFEVKRRAIINMDRQGHYIPLCTRRVFLKYYDSQPSAQHYYFWGKNDRKHYLEEINRVLKHYLPSQNSN